MANNSDDYIISEHEDSSDEIVEMTPVPLVKKKRGRPAKTHSSAKVTSNVLESAGGCGIIILKNLMKRENYVHTVSLLWRMEKYVTKIINMMGLQET